ncbi:hypothetical protein [Chromobacterium sp. IIBBL 290-4]|uniref:hypothetical protein n=1 Tax=Chromobacterium sp. IIBBL 290-4 TaxID=2953890 RepID=UPI0020B6F099|nr:hypothetical protein [Chromobacterium sp. IIBBL 290-4]UTH74245.1 hypothetical protein NKT35_22345 [Chromobacterium sp. IIBBL 290-4]
MKKAWLLGFLSVCLTAQAAKVDVFTPDAAWMQRAQILLQGIKNPKFFRAPGGLIGIAGEMKGQPGQPAVLYTDSNARMIVFGQVIDLESRKNLTADALAMFSPGSDVGKLAGRLSKEMEARSQATDKLIADMKRENGDLERRVAIQEVLALPSIDVGSGRRTLSVFVEPQCAACQTAIREINAWVGLPQNTGRMRVRWIPFSFGAPASTQSAAAIFGGGIEALKRLGNGQLSTDKQWAAKGAFKLEQVSRFIEKSAVKSSPLLVFHDGKAVRIFNGYPGLNVVAGLQ